MTLDFDKVRTKLQYVRDTVRRLEDIRSRGREAFLSDSILQSASERYLQIGIEAILDLATHIIAREGLAIPTTYRAAMETLLRGRDRSRGGLHDPGKEPRRLRDVHPCYHPTLLLG